MVNIGRYKQYPGSISRGKHRQVSSIQRWKFTEVVVYANCIGLRRFYRNVVNIGRWSSYEGGQLDRLHCINVDTNIELQNYKIRNFCNLIWESSCRTSWMFSNFDKNSGITLEIGRVKIPQFQSYISCIHTKKNYLQLYTGCHRRNGPNFGRVFLMLNYTDITQNTYVQSWTVSEIMASEDWNFDSCYTLTDCQIHIETGRNM